MSYCRWSSDNFNCDVYAYEHVDGGFAIHLCGGRYKGEIPKNDMSFLKDNTEENRKKYIDSSTKQSAYLKTCGTEPIGLPHAGETFMMPDLESFYEKMVELKEIGYRIPKYVFEGIQQEIKDND